MAEEKENKVVLEDENKIDTVIADDIDFRGKLIFKNSLKIKGYIEGKIETEGKLYSVILDNLCDRPTGRPGAPVARRGRPTPAGNPSD